MLVFGVPLGVALRRLYYDEAFSQLQREATRPTSAVPNVSPLPPEGVELPDAEEHTTLGLYLPDGTRLRGGGPARADAAVAAALAGRATDQRGTSELVVAIPVDDGDRVVAAIRAALPRSAVDSHVRRAWAGLVGLGIAALLLATVAAIVQARRLSRPLVALADAARRLGEGDLPGRPEPAGVPEVDAVAEVLDATAVRLLGLLDRERSFSADASHQLRTPLAGMRLRLESARLIPGADQGAAIDHAIAEADRLEQTIDELLALARDTIAPRDRLDPVALVAAVEEHWHGAAAARGRKFVSRVDRGLPAVAASPAAVRHILDVLIGNALEHGEGTIAVRVREAAGAVAVDVSDEGGGVELAETVAVFARRSSAEPGRGIGLALARSLAEAEGGRLVLHHPGPAPVFTLLLTATAPPDATPVSPTGQV